MRAVIKHLLSNYFAIDDEIIVIENGIISVYAFDAKLAVDVASWLVRQMPDRNLDLVITERFMDFKVSLVRRN